jgi:hypothetical protein
MDHPLTNTAAAANDNRDLFETPERAYFQIRKARRRHLALDMAAMAPERFREWRVVLAGLDEAEQALLPHLRAGRSAVAAAGVASGGGRPGALAGLVRIFHRLRARAGRRRG